MSPNTDGTALAGDESKGPHEVCFHVPLKNLRHMAGVFNLFSYRSRSLKRSTIRAKGLMI